MPDDDPWTNLFTRYKQHIDDQIAAAFHGALGLPSVVSRNLNTRWPDEENGAAGAAENNDNNHNNQVQDQSAPSSRRPQPRETFYSLSPMRTLFQAAEITDSLYQVMWISFLIDSPYSPLNLRDLPQPTPRDMPEGADPGLFGFEDAFEDLLMASSGQGIYDIHERHEMKKEWYQSFPRGLPPILWLHQLCRQGLWEGWEDRPSVLEDHISERWRRWLEEQEDPFRGRAATENRGDAEVGQPNGSEMGSSEDPKKLVSPKSIEERETEEDMYNGLARMDRMRSIEDHMDVLMKAFRPFDESPRRDRVAADIEAKQPLPEGWKVDETVREDKDGNGNVKMTRTRITFNEKGKEVGRETTTQSRFAWSSHDNQESHDTAGKEQVVKETERADDTTSGRNDGVSSWFWK